MPTPAAQPAIGRKSLRILVAEDSPLNQQVVLRQLEALGCHATAVDDGAKAVDAFAAGNFNIILMDCQLPEMSGYEATWQIRDREKQQAERLAEQQESEGASANQPAAHPIYIIAMTANTEVDNREKCMEAGMDDFINKPVQLPELEAVLLRALANRAAVKELDAIIDPIIIAGLRQLRTPGGPDPLPPLVDLFLKEAPTHLDAINNAILKNDMAAMAHVISSASALKGSAGNLGARNLAALSDEIVQAARLGLLADALPVLDRAREEFTRARSALEKIKTHPSEA